MKESLMQTVSKSREYTMQVIEAMPENGFSFKPSGAGWDFTELINHIAYGIYWWKENFVRENKVEWAPPPAVAGKKGIINLVKKAYDSLNESIGNGNLSENAVYGIHATLDHVTHHRGQAVLYLRSKGINPPEYTY